MRKPAWVVTCAMLLNAVGKGGVGSITAREIREEESHQFDAAQRGDESVEVIHGGPGRLSSSSRQLCGGTLFRGVMPLDTSANR
jgi:hypothetical protein